MKLRIYSDLHLEFESFEPPAVAADVVILAGDIHVKKHGVSWAAATFGDCPVLYVPGNHEYYGRAYPKHVVDLQSAAAGTTVRVLENDRFDLEGVTFLGCTLWTNFELFGNPRVAGYEATETLNDYRKVRVSPQYRRLRSRDTAAIHYKSVDWLQTELAQAKSQGRSTVVITHHAPSQRSLPEHRRGDILSAAYASDLEAFIEEASPTLWVHGHIHTQRDYYIGSTRVICNPRGYPDEPNRHFVPDSIVEI